MTPCQRIPSRSRDPEDSSSRKANLKLSDRFLTASPLYCFKQCRRRHVFASQNDVIWKSSLFFWRGRMKTWEIIIAEKL